MADLSAASDNRTVAGAATIGFALGGFFDGILLHQVLQWHHLFSLVSGETWRDMRMQILMDGWFHVLHWVIAAFGLWLLWTAPPRGRAADKRVLGAALLGFSVWQFVDVVLFHWIFMIHRIRVDVPNPLAYDLGWLITFGVTTLGAGLWLWRSQGGTSGRAGPALAMLALLAAPVAALPQPGAVRTVVMFRSGTDPARALAAVAALDAAIVWTSPSGDAIAFAPNAQATAMRQAWQLYSSGALLVSNSPIFGGCLAWARI